MKNKKTVVAKPTKLMSRDDWYARVYVTIPLLTDEESAGLELSLGAVSLNCEGRTFILDSYETSFDAEAEESGICEFCSKLEVDLDTFPKTKKDKYDLTFEDLKSKKITGLFYCSDVDATDGMFDFKKAKATLVIFTGGKEIHVKIKLEQ